MAAVFDLHFHPLAKRFLHEFDDEKRQNGAYADPLRIPLIGQVADAAVGFILETQASIAQAVKGEYRLGVAAIVSTEYVFASRKGVLKLLEYELFERDLFAPLDNRLFDFINESQGSYHQLFAKELQFYKWAAGLLPLTKPETIIINLVNRKAAGGARFEAGKLNLLLAVEGGHNFCELRINEAMAIPHPARLIRKYREDKSVDFLYLTLTHLSHVQEQCLCSHAFGFKLVKDIPEARPQADGLTDLGKQVINACINTNTNQAPILIDIKHMSLQGRRDFYAYRKTLLHDPPADFTPPSLNEKPLWPIVATHMGVTGYDSRDLGNFIKEYGVEEGNEHSIRVKLSRQMAGVLPVGLGFSQVFFNPATINLCNDDITEIALSDGLIGISLDARILGFDIIIQRRYTVVDYFSKGDFARFFPELAQRLNYLEPEPDEADHADEPVFLSAHEGRFQGLAGRITRETYLFCLNVLHIVAVINRLPLAERHNRDGWDFVCLGTDYDGLIDSIKAARTAESLPAFKKELVHYLTKAEKAYRETFTGTPSLLTENVEVVLDKLFYTNGENFIKRWWGMV
ncbi:hypothetical protein I5M27_16735 [Adhaeribacter sp. BT258]|uniref:Membrane dipeptidase (Peptidase family M19) n=1 Tax=Adhaeribacter terrigena TaxID=2793070 RepID=A0ABS1C5I8_9BACT|nr:hypothetical protein [Adhaeribacter terrigena]MBK0404644.1 hypothetical protein [Adhaeribacter terrigena]